MTTARTSIRDALSALSVLAPGAEPNADELDIGLSAIGDLLLELHDARGPLTDVDVVGNYTAAENQRLRLQAGINVNISLPNAVSVLGYYNVYDYGFAGSLLQIGTASASDGVMNRQIRDGSRVEIVGTTQALYWYRADINAWVLSSGLTLDSELPLNNRYSGHFAARLAERIADTVGGVISPILQRRIARANAALLMQPGVPRDPVWINDLSVRGMFGVAGSGSVPTPPNPNGGALDFTDSGNSDLTVAI